MIQSNVALKNRHKSKKDYLILDSKMCDLEIRIILIQIKFFEQLANKDKHSKPRFNKIGNIKGIQHPIKRSRIFTHLKSLASDIMYLQETHLRNNEYDKLKKNWIGQVFHSDYGDRSGGAAMLLRRGLPFTPLNTIPSC